MPITPSLDGRELLQKIQQQARSNIKKMDQEHNREAFQAVTRKRCLVDNKPKIANRQIFKNTPGQSSTYLAYKDPETGLLTDDPKEMKQIVESYFKKELRAPRGEKTGLYHRDETPRSYPWDKKQP